MHGPAGLRLGGQLIPLWLLLLQCQLGTEPTAVGQGHGSCPRPEGQGVPLWLLILQHWPGTEPTVAGQGMEWGWGGRP